jgi:hypothetical protein
LVISFEGEDINYYFLMMGGNNLHNKNVHARTKQYKIIKNSDGKSQKIISYIQ